MSDMSQEMMAAVYQPFSPDTLKDPMSAHARLRAECPVHFYPDFEPRGFYTFSRFNEVDDLFRSIENWSADWGQGPLYVKEGGLKSDPPVHTVYRRLVTGAFTNSRTAAMQPVIEEVAEGLISRFAARGSADLMAEFAVPLPTTIICTMIGIPTDDLELFKSWSDDFMAGQNSSDPEVQGAARAKIDAYFKGELVRRREMQAAGEALPDDMLTSLLTAENEGRPFTDEELLPLLLLLLVGGNETTTSLIGSLVWRLLDTGLWDRVSSDPALWDVAIEESLRFDPPVMGMFRTAKGDQTVCGVTIPDESKVMGLFASANRDPDVWDHPDEFRLDRDLNELRKQNMAFGRGIFFCPAAALARLEASVALRIISERLPNLRLSGEPERVESFMMWGPTTLPVIWDHE